MGQTASNVTKKILTPFRNQHLSKRSFTDPGSLAVAPYVFQRRGSMYFDEDGDLAHEFYEEVQTSNGTEMKLKPKETLLPQGYVELPYPRLNMDFPVVLCEVRSR